MMAFASRLWRPALFSDSDGKCSLSVFGSGSKLTSISEPAPPVPRLFSSKSNHALLASISLTSSRKVSLLLEALHVLLIGRVPLLRQCSVADLEFFDCQPFAFFKSLKCTFEYANIATDASFLSTFLECQMHELGLE